MLLIVLAGCKWRLWKFICFSPLRKMSEGQCHFLPCCWGVWETLVKICAQHGFHEKCRTPPNPSRPLNNVEKFADYVKKESKWGTEETAWGDEQARLDGEVCPAALSCGHAFTQVSSVQQDWDRDLKFKSALCSWIVYFGMDWKVQMLLNISKKPS